MASAALPSSFTRPSRNVPADADTEPVEDDDHPIISKRGPVYVFAEPIGAWVKEIESIALACRCWSALRNEDQKELASLNGCLKPAEGPLPSEVAWAWPSDNPPDNPVATAMEYLVTQGLRDRVSGILQRKEDGTGWEAEFRPLSLIGAIWLQLSQAIANGVWKDCKHCGTPFKPKNTRAEYCTESHRQRAYQIRTAERESK